MASLTTNFNVSPYFDDYEEAKRYYRILFKPSVAVQARELTQAQTIQQKQIERFGNHVFKDGSVVEGCGPTALKNLNFVRVSDQFVVNTSLKVTDISNEYLLVGQTSNVRASVVISKKGLLDLYPDTNRFYVSYISPGVNDKKVFDSGEVIKIYNENQNKLGTIDEGNYVDSINVITSNSTVNAIGAGYGLRIENGVIYQKGFFQIIDDQTLIIKDFDQETGDYVVGFSTNEEIITEYDDESLKDNALGYSNENAPGAHRLKLTVVPVVRKRQEIENDESFFSVFEFSNITNDLIINRSRTSYDELGEVLGQRTFEESGDYVTKTFLTDSEPSANVGKFCYTVSSGVGYVRGNRVEYESARRIETDKAITTAEALQQSITANYGNFVYINEVRGALDFSSFVTVDIYNAAAQAVSNHFNSTSAYGTKIGTAKVKAILHNELNPGTAEATYRLYLSDIVMDSNYNFYNDAKSFYLNSPTYGYFYGDIVLNGGKAVIQQSGKSTLVFPIGKSAIKTLRSQNGATNETEFYFRNSSVARMDANGAFTVTAPAPSAGGIEELGYSTGLLGDVLEDQFLITMKTSANSVNTGIAFNVSSPRIIITGTNTKDGDLAFSAGEYIILYDGSSAVGPYPIKTANSTTLELYSPVSGTFTSSANTAKHYPAGYQIPMDNSYPGTRTVNVTSSTTFDVNVNFDALAALENSVDVVVQYRMRRKQATQAKKEVRRDRYVQLDAGVNVNSWNLGIPDVFKISKVYANPSSYSTSDSDDATSYFLLDDGQKPDYYDHSKLVLKPEYSGLFNNYKFVVKFDHFVPVTTSGDGFFTVDSYPVDDINLANTAAIQTVTIPTFNYEDISIKLRDAVDFRPQKVRTANSAIDLATATTNPTTTNTFAGSKVKYLTEPDTNFQANIEYYLGRKDLITLNIAGKLNVVKGIPAEKPLEPRNTSEAMVLAVADVPPYPTLTNDEAEALGVPLEGIQTKTNTNRVYTMRDIGVLDDRIQNLEYYTSLLALEIAAKDIDVKDEDGNNRFKNGIFVEPMSTYDFHDTENPEYKFTLDFDDSYGRSTFDQNDIQLELNEDTSSGVVKTGRYLTRPYTEELFIFQPYATKYRNNAQDYWKWIGSVALLPSYDVNNSVSQGGRSGGGKRKSKGSFSVKTKGKGNGNKNNGNNGGGSVDFKAFMDATNISLVASGLKPNTIIYPFFDGIAIKQYCAPAKVNTALGATLEEALAAATKKGRQEDTLVRDGKVGDALKTDANGNLLAIFSLPANTFKVGDRILRLVDVDNLALGEDAILTQASAVFTGYSISVTFPPPPPPSLGGGTGTGSGKINRPITKDPLAQSFFVESSAGQSGVFLTGLDLFFKSKDPALGLEIVVIGMENGVPSYTDVKGSTTISSSKVFVSDNASVATPIKFDFPIFLTSDRQYAFYVVPEGNNPNYQMWVCEMGKYDVLTKAQVYQNPYSGDLFRSSNQATWTALPTEDAKFNLYVANFEVGSGYAIFQNENDDFMVWSDVVTPDPTKSISVGNEVYKIVSPSNITIDSAFRNKPSYIQYFDSDGNVTLDNPFQNVFLKTIPAQDGPPPVAEVPFYVGIFNPPQQGNTAQCNSDTLVATAKITDINNPIMHAIIPKMLVTTPSGTNVGFEFKATSNTGVIDGNYVNVITNELKEISDYERVIYSTSNQKAANLPKTFTLKATLTNSDKYVSPIVDLTRKRIIAIENIINNNYQDEQTGYGKSLARYISKPVVLADGQDAEDFLLYLTGYRPINTDILVYVKFLSGQDPASLNDKSWTKLEFRNSTLRSSSINTTDYKEFVYGIPASLPATGSIDQNPTAAYRPTGSQAPSGAVVRYKDASGAEYFTYKSFVVKVVLLSTNKVTVPKVKDIRALALQL